MEAVFDEEKQAFLVFFASKVKCNGEKQAKHRIYAAYTKDFDTFSDTFLYMERETENLSSGNFTILEKEKYDLGITKKRHGGVLELSDAEFEKLIETECW